MADSSKAGMRDNVRGLVRMAVFIVLTAFVLLRINKVLEPKNWTGNNTWPTTASISEFYQTKDNTVDVLFLGSSFCVNAFNPQQYYEEHGIRSFNLGSEQQSVFVSYWWLREALRSQHPRVVVLETTFLKKSSDDLLNTPEGLMRKAIDPMRWSPIKMQCVRDICEKDPAQDELSYYLTNLRFHERWEELSVEDVNADLWARYPLRGYAPSVETYEQDIDDYEPYDVGTSEEQVELDPLMVEYLERMASLCKGEGIELVLVSVPSPKTGIEVHNPISVLASRLGLRHYDAAEKNTYEAIGARWPDQSILGHMNTSGARLFNAWFGNVLADEIGVGAVTDAQWEDTQAYYDRAKETYALLEIEDPVVWLQTVARGGYDVFSCVKVPMGVAREDPLAEALVSVGVDERALLGEGDALAVRYCDGACMRDASSLKGVFDSGCIGYAMNLNTLSVGGMWSSKTSTRGATLIVYDRQTQRVVEVLDIVPGGEGQGEGRGFVLQRKRFT